MSMLKHHVNFGFRVAKKAAKGLIEVPTFEYTFVLIDIQLHKSQQ